MFVDGKLLLRFVLLQSIVVVAFSSCICPVAHPQQNFCKHEYALKIKITFIYPNVSKEYRYDAEIHATYKGNTRLLTFYNTEVAVRLPPNCLFKNVTLGQRYIIFGRVNNRRLQVQTCSGSMLWKTNVTRDLNSNYPTGCACMNQDQFKNMTYRKCKWNHAYINSGCTWTTNSEYNKCFSRYGC